MMGVLRNVGFRSFEGSTGLALDVPGPPCGVVFVTNCRPVETLGRGVARKRRTPEATVVVIRSAHRGHFL